MPDSEDETAAKIDRALSESQRLEREEREADLRRQNDADRRVAEALSDKHPPG